MSGGSGSDRTPRGWIEGEAYPWPALDDVAEGARLSGCYCVASKQIALTKNDKPYLRLQLCDRSGEIEGRVWDDAERVGEQVAEGGFVGVRGRMESFRGQRQLKVEEIVPIDVAPEELELFLPRTSHDLEELEAQLDALIGSVEDSGLNALLVRLLGRDSETGRAFRRAPAAKRNHHAYVGGLLEHTVSIGWVCSSLASHYGAALDRDLLLTGALLHDIGKIREIGVSGGFPYTDEGKLLGHIVIGIQIVEDAARETPALPRDRALLVQHLVASHQGRYEWQSPKIPMTLEAMLLHYVDDLDAKMNQALALVASAEKGWTGYDPSFGREFLRHLDDVEEKAGATAAAEPPAEAADEPEPALAVDGDDDLPWYEAGERRADVDDADENVEAAVEDVEAVAEEVEAVAEEEDERDAVPHDPSGGGASTGKSGGQTSPRPLRFDYDTLDLFGD